jgi:hypothetical protein
MVAVVAEELDS